MSGGVAIELRAVSKRYRDVVALEPTDLEIREGEFFCLLGPSGCGKTTTLNLLGGLVQVSSGEIFIEGQRADRIPPHKRNVNTVFQGYALFPHLSVYDNVGFGLKMARISRGDARPRIAQALALVGLEQHAERFRAALRWPAAAGCGRAGAGQPAGRGAARRAARGARPEAAKAPADRARADPP